MKLTAAIWQAATVTERRTLLPADQWAPEFAAQVAAPDTDVPAAWFWAPGFAAWATTMSNPLPLPDASRLNYRSLVESLGAVALQSGIIPPQLAADLTAIRGPERALHDAWLTCLAPTLNAAYTAYLQPVSTEDAETRKQSFLQSLWSGGLATLFASHPVLLRLLATRTHFWQASLQELLTRWDQDRAEATARLVGSAPSGRLLSIELGLSDAHGGGRTVAFLTLDGGQRLVYKPKSLRMDAAISGHYAQLKILGHPLLGLAPDVWDRGDYGWAAFCVDDTAAKHAPAPELARRLGQLNAFAHALGCTDLHSENFAVVEGQPVMWDLETLLRPHFELDQRSNRQHPARRAILSRYEESVIGTGMIDDHLPKKDAAWQLAPAAWPPFIEGFQEVYQWQAKHRDAFAAVWESPGNDFPIRSVLLPTAQYATQLQASLQPGCLVNGVVWVQALATIRLSPDPHNAFEQWIHAAEIEAMARCDVPAFHLHGDTLKEAGGATRDLAAAGDSYIRPLDHAQAKWQQLGPNDLDLQLRLLRFHQDDTAPLPAYPLRTWPKRLKVTDTTQLENAGLQMAEQILGCAEQAGDSAQWWNQTVSSKGKARLAPILAPLYDGTIGVALLLGAAYRISGDPKYQAGARAALRPILHDFRDPWRRQRVAAFLGLGGAAGYPSILLACRHLSRWNVAEESHELAQIITQELITPEEIAADRSFDVISGVAGSILCLLPVGDSPVGKTTVDRARAAGEHLLSSLPAPTQPWQPDQHAPLGGLSHGAAGFAQALHRLAQATGESRFTTESERWIAYQESLQHPDTHQFRDLRDKKGHGNDWSGKAMCSWCHGAPGIALAWSELGRNEVALTSLTTTLSYPQENGRDFLCCGNYGRLASALTAALRLEQTTVIEEIQHRAQVLLPTATGGEFAWRCGQNRDNLGFHTGLAGIGYTLLRCAQPEELPCILGYE